MWSFINTAEDMKWLREVHLPRLHKKYKSAMLHGNEDAPERIEVWERKNPYVYDKPLVYEMQEDMTYMKV